MLWRLWNFSFRSLYEILFLILTLLGYIQIVAFATSIACNMNQGMMIDLY